MAPMGKNVASESSTRRSQKEAAYLGDEYVDEGCLLEDFPHIHTRACDLGIHYTFVDQGLIRNNRVRFTLEVLNEFLGSPICDNSEYIAMIERPPYRDMRHTLFGVTSMARWDRGKSGASLSTDEGGDNNCRSYYEAKHAKMCRMFGMPELYLRISGRPMTEDEMATLAEQPIDNDDATTDENDGADEDESDDPGPGYYNTDEGNVDGDATSMRGAPVSLVQQGHDAPCQRVQRLYFGALAVWRARLPGAKDSWISKNDDVVSPVVDRNEVGVTAPKMLSSLTKTDVDENDVSRNTNYILIYNDIILVAVVTRPLDKNNKFHFVSIENW
ncbi:hypothetical protein H5410_045879 [Solanum commersonii]|uniref:Uncharacterized protein n=1 Tax=Solanum commersonii TaxID=4109 RepID=A0A9J5XCU2_SOLCO|nr:hypothetical protein H5410_045879 [Solanum commersonii]